MSALKGRLFGLVGEEYSYCEESLDRYIKDNRIDLLKPRQGPVFVHRNFV